MNMSVAIDLAFVGLVLAAIATQTLLLYFTDWKTFRSRFEKVEYVARGAYSRGMIALHVVNDRQSLILLMRRLLIGLMVLTGFLILVNFGGQYLGHLMQGPG